MGKEKNLGQIFTPPFLVRDILDLAGYKSDGAILGKHVIDNSCGDGAFLVEVIERYCRAYLKTHSSSSALADELATYVHGIEQDPSVFQSCMANIAATSERLGFKDVRWDIRNADALDIDDYDGKMDFVVGNPPYVRVHNLEDNFERVKKYRFCGGGMTDLYLVFYEIGLEMLAPGGRLAYIAPSSWLNSVAGRGLREYAMESGSFRFIADLGHFQPFSATTYTAIVVFEKGEKLDHFTFSEYDAPHQIRMIAELGYEDVYFDNAFYLGKPENLHEVRKIKTAEYHGLVEVKNGFATLADDVFISDGFPFSSCVIPVIKASTGKWRKAFYPYDKNGKALPKDIVFASKNVSEYLMSHREELLKGRSETEMPEWYLYGRTQALKDVWRRKFAINSVVRDKESIKFNLADVGSGVYGGLYILTDLPEDAVKSALVSDEFIAYVKILKKYKSGGYYTFNSKDVSQFLNFMLLGKYPSKTSVQMHLSL